MTKTTAHEAIERTVREVLADGVFLCVRLGTGTPLVEACRAAVRGGLSLLEITLTTPGAPAYAVLVTDGWQWCDPYDASTRFDGVDAVDSLNAAGVTTFVVLTLSGLLEPERPTSQELSYLADTILLLRYFEATGAVRTSISVVKHRTADHERLIREFDIGRGGIRIGEPITEFENVLAGTPHYRGGGGELLEPRR